MLKKKFKTLPYYKMNPANSWSASKFDIDD